MQGAALTAQAEDGGQMKIKRENTPSHTYAENTKITITTVHYYSKIRSKKNVYLLLFSPNAPI